MCAEERQFAVIARVNWLPPATIGQCWGVKAPPSPTHSSAASTALKPRGDVQGFSVRQLKQFLQSRGVSTVGVYEKSDLVNLALTHVSE